MAGGPDRWRSYPDRHADSAPNWFGISPLKAHEAAAMTVIDIHAHLVPQSFPPPPPGVPERGWPTMVPLPDGTARMIIDGTEFRIFEPAYWDIAGRIAY